jgi:hypothetical protein
MSACSDATSMPCRVRDWGRGTLTSSKDGQGAGAPAGGGVHRVAL